MKTASLTSFRAAALLGLIATAVAAQANIVVYDPEDITIPAGGTGYGYYFDLAKGLYTQDLNASWVGNDANVLLYMQPGPIYKSLGMALNNGTTNAAQLGAAWQSTIAPGPVSLNAGLSLGTTGPYTWGRNTGSTNFGAFRQDRTGYLGLRFLNSTTGQLNYGWMEITTTVTGGNTAKVNRWAFDDTGASILTGQTQAVPEPASLAALGLGALAIVRRRRRA